MKEINRKLLMHMLLCGVFIFSCRFERSRSFFIHTDGDLYKITNEGDFTNLKLIPYTINDSIYVLILDIGYPEANRDDIKKDIAVSTYMLQIYTKSSNDIKYCIRNMKLNSSSYTGDIKDLIYYPPKNKMHYGETDMFFPSKFFPYGRMATINGGYFKFPRPKDMKFSIDIEIEVIENEKKEMYNFTYYYTMAMKDHWIRLLD
jgi:hypothetical protein